MPDSILTRINRFNTELDAVLSRMTVDLDRMMAGYATDGANFKGDDLMRTANARAEILRIAEKAGYNQLIDKYTNEVYTDMARQAAEQYADWGINPAFSSVDAEALSMAAGYDFDELKSISDEAAQLVSRQVFQAVAGQADKASAIAAIREQLPAYYKRWASTYVYTASYNFSRRVDTAIQEEAGIERFVYDGPLDDNTRDFCADMVGKEFTAEEIDQMDNGQTPVGTVREMGGGYNCRHRWLPAESELTGAPAEEMVSDEEPEQIDEQLGEAAQPEMLGQSLIDNPEITKLDFAKQYFEQQGISVNGDFNYKNLKANYASQLSAAQSKYNELIEKYQDQILAAKEERAKTELADAIKREQELHDSKLENFAEKADFAEAKLNDLGYELDKTASSDLSDSQYRYFKNPETGGIIKIRTSDHYIPPEFAVQHGYPPSDVDIIQRGNQIFVNGNLTDPDSVQSEINRVVGLANKGIPTYAYDPKLLEAMGVSGPGMGYHPSYLKSINLETYDALKGIKPAPIVEHWKKSHA